METKVLKEHKVTGNGTIEWFTPDNRNAFSSISIGGSTISASSVGDSFSITAVTMYL